MLLCDGFQESLRYQESRCLFQFRARMCQGLNKSCHAERTNICPSSMSFQTCQLMGHWFSNPVHISITVTASTKQRSHMQVSSSDHRERTILSTGSIFAKGQINEECVLHNVASWQSLSLADTSDLVSRRFLMPSSDGFQESLRYQESRCLFQFRARMCEGLNKSCHAGRANTCPSSMSFQSCQLMGRSCSNAVHINHQCWRKGRHAGVSQWPLWEN